MQRIEREGMTNFLETWEVTFYPQHLLIIPRTIAHPLHTSGSAPGGLFPCLVSPWFLFPMYQRCKH